MLVQQLLLVDVDVAQPDLAHVARGEGRHGPESSTSSWGPGPVSTATGMPCMLPEGVIEAVL